MAPPILDSKSAARPEPGSASNPPPSKPGTGPQGLFIPKFPSEPTGPRIHSLFGVGILGGPETGYQGIFIPDLTEPKRLFAPPDASIHPGLEMRLGGGAGWNKWDPFR